MVRIARLIRHDVVSLFPEIGEIVTAMGAPTFLAEPRGFDGLVAKVEWTRHKFAFR